MKPYDHKQRQLSVCSFTPVSWKSGPVIWGEYFQLYFRLWKMQPHLLLHSSDMTVFGLKPSVNILVSPAGSQVNTITSGSCYTSVKNFPSSRALLCKLWLQKQTGLLFITCWQAWRGMESLLLKALCHTQVHFAHLRILTRIHADTLWQNFSALRPLTCCLIYRLQGLVAPVSHYSCAAGHWVQSIYVCVFIFISMHLY